ncbi:unnamed protein product [Dovyalis caffra]|uniref:Mechanosensitive ion channel MscS domain-containing protein n=1 Tax=Dovyalis caffra TaxID=77055 RepID=A0AAV1RZV6_9ROSI|nr:unnamed protein product [Dovyalis caffra]
MKCSWSELYMRLVNWWAQLAAAAKTCWYIEEEDLLRFLKTEEVHTIFPLFEGAIETGKITKSSFRNWVVHAYVERKALAHSLNDTRTAVQQLHKIASAIVTMIVEEMNILTTVFLRYDSEKIYYPNSVLVTKPISNFRRSPDMGDAIDITIDVSTPVDDFNALKRAIRIYIESKPKHWNPKHTLLVREIENVNKMKLTLCVLHTMNHQNYGEKSTRRSELVFELKKIFDNLGIKCHLLPQQVHLTNVNTISNGGCQHNLDTNACMRRAKRSIITTPEGLLIRHDHTDHSLAFVFFFLP